MSISNFNKQEKTGNDLPSNLFCNSWKDLSSILYQEPKQIIFDIGMVNQNGTTIFEFMAMLETLIKLAVPERTISIGIGINKDTPYSLIKDLRKTSVAGIIPASMDFGYSESNLAIESLMKDNRYWPKHIIDQLPGNKKITITKSEVKLTNRQSQIYNLIATRGLSNKQIARTLNISESTVKVHVSAIMKALCVRNRTQLALTK